MQSPTQSPQNRGARVGTDVHPEQRHVLEVGIIREEVDQAKTIAGMTDTSSAPDRDDLAVPDLVATITEQPRITKPQIETMETTYKNSRAAIRKDLQSGYFEIPPFASTQNIDDPIQEPVRYQFPPALMPSGSRSQHRRRFDRSALLPDSNLPFCTQVMEHVKDWAEWGTRIRDEQRRKEVLDHVFDVLSKAWYEALRLGYNPGTTSTKGGAPQVSSKRSVQHEDEIPARLPRGKPRSKRDISPTKMPVLVASHRHGPAWAVTAGELEEVGISESKLRRRAAAKDSLGAVEELLGKVLEDYGGEIQPKDWDHIMDVTRLNPMGRDLMVYCLYEVLKSRDNLKLLQKYYNHFNTVRQKGNTKRRIDEEQERHDLFVALALELDEENPSPGDSTAFDSSTSCEGSADGVPATTKDESLVRRLEVLIRLIGGVLDATDVSSIASSFEYSGVSRDDLFTEASPVGTSRGFGQCKHILWDMQPNVQEWLRLSKIAELAIEQDGNVDLRAQIRNLELKILDQKETLMSRAPFSTAKQIASTRSDDRSNARTEHFSDATSTSATFRVGSPTAEDVSRVSSDNAAKHRLDITDEETALPPTKKPKTDQGRGVVDHPIPMVDEEQMNRNSHKAATPNNKDGARISCGSPSEIASREARHDGRVRLHIPRHFRPDDFTTKRVFCHPKGFRFRFTAESTLSQRRSFKEALEMYIESSVENRKEYVFGRYEVVADPNDPGRTPVVHGVWDLKNGSEPEGFEWFYQGDGTYPVTEKEISPLRDPKDKEDLPAPAPQNKKPVVILKLKNRMQRKVSDSPAGAATGTDTSSVIKPTTMAGARDKNKKQKTDKQRRVRFTVGPPAVAYANSQQSTSDRPKRRAVSKKSSK
ncbi:hypothetical protein Z517_03164 [Fonsecaea pedrosoi CBS 271.37]|uniref:Uncharacterized protein n=1 Tax=Fonsecaea pedrosoi CBS 271.37 TaxID=1442368 RepID=A0A0D2GSG1_9EURO|nr:uncharacterized protein Z517_03164 [Fonsecaea pedrosoi CBS 271.37]KIW83918.1 hypothetical protein Z517_03164 [Fonsecaea pedrosoi CBS 271.37]